MCCVHACIRVRHARCAQQCGCLMGCTDHVHSMRVPATAASPAAQAQARALTPNRRSPKLIHSSLHPWTSDSNTCSGIDICALSSGPERANFAPRVGQCHRQPTLSNPLPAKDREVQPQPIAEITAQNSCRCCEPGCSLPLHTGLRCLGLSVGHRSYRSRSGWKTQEDRRQRRRHDTHFLHIAPIEVLLERPARCRAILSKSNVCRLVRPLLLPKKTAAACSCWPTAPVRHRPALHLMNSFQNAAG